MKVQYFKDTDTLYIEFRAVEIVESRDLDEDTVIDLDGMPKTVPISLISLLKKLRPDNGLKLPKTTSTLPRFRGNLLYLIDLFGKH